MPVSSGWAGMTEHIVQRIVPLLGGAYDLDKIVARTGRNHTQRRL